MSKMKAQVFEDEETSGDRRAVGGGSAIAGEGGLREQVSETEWVVYRTGYPKDPKPLEYIEAKRWDLYLHQTPETKCEFISRGHTLVEAINLTKLANEGVKE